MVGRLLRTADFERVLARPPCSRSAHFAAHHLAAEPSLPARPARRAEAADLSTGDAPACPPPVEDSPAKGPEGGCAAPRGCWLGMVVPKRHARRSVTRNLIKRAMRAALAAAAADPVAPLPAGLWVLRLKAPFDRQRFHSPASELLREDAGAELRLLLQRAAAARPAAGR